MGARTIGASLRADDAAIRIGGPTVLIEEPLDLVDLSVEVGDPVIVHAAATFATEPVPIRSAAPRVAITA